MYVAEVVPVVLEPGEELAHVQVDRLALGHGVLSCREAGLLVRAFIDEHSHPAETAAVDDVPFAIIVPVADERRRLVAARMGALTAMALLA